MPDHPKATVTESLADILDATRLLTLATVSSRGDAHANIAFFAFDDDFRLYILSHEATEHARHLEENASAAVTVFDSHQRRESRRGAQLFGTMSVLEGEEADRALACFGARFDDIGAAGSHAEILRRFRSRFFGFVPTRAKVFDETLLIPGDYVEVDIRSAVVADGVGTSS